MNASARTYSAPVVNEETRAYWDGANEGKLLLKRCTACSKTHFYPRVHCPHCQSSATEWYEAKGTGKVYSYSVMRRAETPFVMAYVTLDEGVTMMTNIVDCDPDSVRIDQAVKVTFKPAEDGQAVPLFTPSG